MVSGSEVEWDVGGSAAVRRAARSLSFRGRHGLPVGHACIHDTSLARCFVTWTGELCSENRSVMGFNLIWCVCQDLLLQVSW